MVGTLTDQYLPPGFPGFRDGRVYPLAHPSLQKAKALARGRLRGGKAVLYVPETGPLISLAQSLKQSVERIGLTIDIEPIPLGAYFDRIGTRSEAFDIAWFPWLAGLRGGARYRAYGKLDLQIARDAAPWVAYMFSKAPTLVSKRVGCIVLRPYIDLAAVCLKR